MKFFIFIGVSLSLVSSTGSAKMLGYSMDEAQVATKLYKIRVAHEMCKAPTAYLGDFDKRLDAFLTSHGAYGTSLSARWNKEKPLMALEISLGKNWDGRQGCAALRGQKLPGELKNSLNNMLQKLDETHRNSKAH